jgi:hypothetical protein
LEQSRREFVEEFHNWNGKTFDSSDGRLSPILRRRESSFRPHLIQERKESIAPPTDPKAQVDGMDFDSFLGALGSADAYRVGSIARKGTHDFAPVFGPLEPVEATPRGPARTTRSSQIHLALDYSHFWKGNLGREAGVGPSARGGNQSQGRVAEAVKMGVRRRLSPVEGAAAA